MSRKWLAVLLAAVLCVSAQIPVYAVTVSYSAENTREVEALESELEKKYGIGIEYPRTQEGQARILAESLQTLDIALVNATPAVVRQVARYYRETTGFPFTIAFVYHNMDAALSEHGIMLAGFEPAKSRIEIYLPIPNRRAYSSGENPITILHELGHAVQLMISAQDSTLNMEADWIKLNGKLGYGNSTTGNVNPRVFVTAYASTTFHEDFADTFGMALACNQAGTGLQNQLFKNGQATRLATKLDYIIRLMPRYFENSAGIVANLQRAYGVSPTYTFEGIAFSGEYLQFRGYPQPKNVFYGLVDALGLSIDKATWSRDLGAWRVIDTSNREFFLFPGGYWGITSELRKRAA